MWRFAFVSMSNVSGKKLSPEQCGRLGRGCCSEDMFSDKKLLFSSLEGKIFVSISGLELL